MESLHVVIAEVRLSFEFLAVMDPEAAEDKVRSSNFSKTVEARRGTSDKEANIGLRIWVPSSSDTEQSPSSLLATW